VTSACGAPPDRRRSRRVPLLLLAALAATACTGGWDRIPAQGEVAGHAIDTTLDDPIAQYYLEHYLPGRGTDPARDRALAAALEPLPDEVPARHELAQLAETFSVDLAALHLIRILNSRPENAALARDFEAHLERVRVLDGPAPQRLEACVQGLDPLPVWFVPGWFYVTQPGTGAAFTRQRALFQRLGVPHRLVPLIENGTIEENAQILADEIRALGPDAAPVILASASKGGPEVAHALGHLLAPEETAPVVAWISVGGLLRGSPLADFATKWPIRWFAPLHWWWVGLDPGESVPSMTTQASEARLAKETIPDHVMIINYVGIPMSGDVTEAAQFGYTRMRSDGPNDGLTPVVDKLAHGGRTIAGVGLDHYFRHPEIDRIALAMTLTVLTELGRELPAACEIEAS
jgi:hypothetical protein